MHDETNGFEYLPAMIQGEPTQARLRHAAAELKQLCHGGAVASGWWTDLKTGEPQWATPKTPSTRNVGELLCLVHSEISEALEGHRKGKMDEHLPHRPSIEVELADAVIRIFDMAGGLRLDVPGAIAEKLAYNMRRADHRPSVRAADGGKKF